MEWPTQFTGLAQGDLSDASKVMGEKTSDLTKGWYFTLGQLKTFLGNAFAKLASPAFTGTPTAPTAPVDTNNTQLATTAFVQANKGSGSGGTTLISENVYNAALPYVNGSDVLYHVIGEAFFGTNMMAGSSILSMCSQKIIYAYIEMPTGQAVNVYLDGNLIANNVRAMSYKSEAGGVSSYVAELNAVLRFDGSVDLPLPAGSGALTFDRSLNLRVTASGAGLI